jgi:hypothetical protein
MNESCNKQYGFLQRAHGGMLAASLAAIAWIVCSAETIEARLGSVSMQCQRAE